MKPETLADVWAMIGFLIARRGQAPSTRHALNAILARHIEQPEANAVDAANLERAIAAVADVSPEPDLFNETLLVITAAEAHLAHLRTVEQPAETEEQAAMSELREWLAVTGTLRAASISPISVKLQDYRAIREWFVTGSNDDAAIREALRLAKETDNAD